MVSGASETGLQHFVYRRRLAQKRLLLYDPQTQARTLKQTIKMSPCAILSGDPFVTCQNECTPMQTPEAACFKQLPMFSQTPKLRIMHIIGILVRQ